MEPKSEVDLTKKSKIINVNNLQSLISKTYNSYSQSYSSESVQIFVNINNEEYVLISKFK